MTRLCKDFPFITAMFFSFFITAMIIFTMVCCQESKPKINKLTECQLKYDQLKRDCERSETFDSTSLLMQDRYISVLERETKFLTNKSDSLIAVNRNLKDSLFLKRAQIANCKKYVRICIKNPSQDQFLIGWIRRALDM